ncbi:hypothetical protein GCM10007049_37530 [Echinicola pacifica]|uniref:Cell division initiation protein n=1 Tax=Echinicola pacifica TaxID=346377 RepID=A0A918UX53_9BACT|nr:DivIVA domain-containing protein [Echinicola pacifica]GGZ40729.1 hypothetical protein GCM10007049_37530 [Echinicola pacifica]
MKITPLEIRQKTFEKIFRGYDKDEVNSFLVTLSQEWEREMDEKRELKIKLEQVQKESAKLREVEDSLFRTLKAAEDTGASIIEQANKTAELILKEAQMNADAIQAESKNNSRNIVDEAETKAKGIIEDLKEDVKVLVDNYEALLSQREMLVRNLKKMASESLDNISQSQDDFKRIDMDVHHKAVKDLNRQSSSFAPEQASRQPKERSHTFVIENKKAESEPSEHESPAAELAEPIPSASPVESSLVIDLREEETPKIPEVKVEESSPAPEPEPEPIMEKAEPKATEVPKPKEDLPASKKSSGSFFDQFD